MNKLLIVDLTRQRYEIEDLPEAVRHDFIGGRGLGAYLLYRNLPAKIAPLAPENVMVFSCGPAQGTSAYYSSRAVLTTKSPLSGAYLYSVASGRLGHRIRKAGYLAIMMTGRAAEPQYLVIGEGTVEFRSAKKFWGLKTVEAHDAMLREAAVEKASCACIGPAGERLVPMAFVATEGEKVRAFGRGGAGAVMGSKNLKGFVISGRRAVPIADPAGFKSCGEAMLKRVKDNPQFVENRRRYGTGADMTTLNRRGILPTRNWQTGCFDKVAGIALTEIEDRWPRKNLSCGPYCLNPCSHSIELKSGPWKGLKADGPEYETIYAFGSNCGIDRFDAVVAAERICDDFGIDTISCGLSVSFAMECYEKGLLGTADTGGLAIEFGNADAMVELVRMIAAGEGLGALLGQGVRAASRQIPGSEGFAMHCKGLEFGGYECRGSWGQALQFALSSRGACHHAFGLAARSPAEVAAPTQVAGKGELVKNNAINRVIFDSAVVCALNAAAIGAEAVADLIMAVSGAYRDGSEIRQAALRTITIERLFNVREGLGRQDDVLPGRLLAEPLPDGPNRGSVVPMDELLDEGYRAMGWDPVTGAPKRKTLEDLGLCELPD